MVEIPNNLYFKRSQICVLFGLTKYRIQQLLEEGTMDAPVIKNKTASFWTRGQIIELARRLDEQSRPKPTIPARPRRSRPLSTKHASEIKRSFR